MPVAAELAIIFFVAGTATLQMDRFVQDLRQVDLDEVGNKVSLQAMSIANAHHPEVIDSRKVVMHDERILIRLLLSRYETLPRLDGMRNDWTFGFEGAIVANDL